MNKKVLVVAFWCALALPMPSYAQADCSLCPELCDAVQQARTAYIDADMAMQEETVLEEQEPLMNITCMDMISSINTELSLTLMNSTMDPTTLGPLIIKAIEKMINHICQAAVDYVNGEINGFISKVNNATTLPYGLGRVVRIDHQTTGNYGNPRGVQLPVQAPNPFP